MKRIKFFFTAAVLIAVQSIAQQPVKFELTKLAETVTIPPATPAEAYAKCKTDEGIDGRKIFGDFYDRMARITKEIYTTTAQQNKLNNSDGKAGEKAMADGFGEMSAAEQAKYMKSHPSLQNATGVNASMLEFAAKMEDPAFKKKFDAMSDREKAKLVRAYQQPQISMSRNQHTQPALKTVMEAARLVSRFNDDYKGKMLAADLTEKEKRLDAAEQKMLEPVTAEKTKVSALVGKGAPDWVGKKLKELIAQEWAIRTKTYEKKLTLYRENILSLVSSYQLSVRSFDDFLARINYGQRLTEDNEMKELAQIAGYQEGLLRELRTIQDLASHITVSAASFHKEKIDANQTN